MVPLHIMRYEHFCTWSSKNRPVARINSVRDIPDTSSGKGEQHVTMAESQSSRWRPPVDAARRSRALLDRLAAGGATAGEAQAIRTFGKAVGRLRVSRGLAREEVAIDSGLNLDDLSLIEWGLLTRDEVRERLPALARGIQTTPEVMDLILQACLSQDAPANSKGGRSDDHDVR